MANRRGRPPVDDQAALRRVAEHIVDMEEQGSPCSSRDAILRTSGRVMGNSPDAVLWRLQRKWRRIGPALLAAARERRMSARRAPVHGSPPADGRLGYPSELARLALAETGVARAMPQHQEALRVLREHRDAVLQAFGPLEELRRVLEDQDALRRFWGCR